MTAGKGGMLEDPSTPGGSAVMSGTGGASMDAGQGMPLPSGPGGKSAMPAGGGSSAGGNGPAGGGSVGGASSVNTPTSAWLAYDGQNAGEKRGIYLVYVPDGGHCQERVTALEISAKQPAFSNDGKLLAYVSDVTGTPQIYTLDLSAGTTRQLTQLEGGASYPAFSPGSGAVVFVSGDPEAYRDGIAPFSPLLGEVMLLDMKTLATETLLTRDPVLGPWSAPVFAGADRILVANGHQLEAVYLADDAYDDHVTVSNRGLSPQDPTPTPDGERVTFIDQCGGVNNLYTMRLDGSQDHSCDSLPLVTTEVGYRSPDWGSYGYIASEFDRPEHGLYIVDPVYRATQPGIDRVPQGRNPAWAPMGFARACVE